MPKKYVQYVPAGTLVPDVTAAPKMMNWIDGVSMDGGKTWSPRTDFLNKNVQAWRKPLIFRTNSSVTDDSCYIGFSAGAVYPDVVAGHTYIFSVEVKNMSSVTMSQNRVIGYAPEGSSTGAPLTANQTEYTRLWRTFTASPGYVFLEYQATVAGQELRYAIRNYAVYDVTGIDPSLYEAIGTQRFIAFRNRFSAVFMKEGVGISRFGNYVGVDTASEDELAAGKPGKAVTADKLKSWIEDSESFKIQDNWGNNVLLDNLAMTYTSEPMEKAATAPNAQNAVWDSIRSVWGTCYNSTYAGMTFSGTTVRNKWIKGNPNGHKYLIAMDMMNQTDKAGTNATFQLTNGTTHSVSGVRFIAADQHKWVRIAKWIEATGDFLVDMMVYGLVNNDNFRFSFKNFAIYDVTYIPESYYPDIALGKKPLLQGKDPVLITNKTISYVKAPVDNIMRDDYYRNAIVDTGSLHDAINLGRAVDVTCGPLWVEGFNQISFGDRNHWQTLDNAFLAENVNDPRWKSVFYVRRANAPTAATNYYLGWRSGTNYNKPFPKVAPKLSYLHVLSAVNMGIGTSIHQMSGGIAVAGGEVPGAAYDPEKTLEEQTKTAWHAFGDEGTSYVFLLAAATAANQTVEMYFIGWRQYEVTSIPAASWRLVPDNVNQGAINSYLIKQDAVCPFVPIINMHDAENVTIASGLAYRLDAREGQHTLSVDTFPEDTQGEDAYIIITTSSVGSISVRSPLILMDPISPNAINNCRISYRAGEARLYVDSFDSGYVVVTASGTDNGTLYYGMARVLPSSLSTEFISIASTLNGTPVQVSGIVSSLSKPISITGNGRDVTDITFLGGVIGTSSALSINNATVRNFTLTRGHIDFSNSRITGDIEITGSAFIGLSRQIALDIDIAGSHVRFGNDASVTGPATIDLMLGNHLVFTKGSLTSITIQNGADRTTGGGLYASPSSTSAIDSYTTLRDVVVTGCSAAGNGGGIAWRNGTITIYDSEISNCISSFSGGGIGASGSYGTFTMRNVYIHHCSAQSAGGIITSKPTEISASTISYCTSVAHSSAIAVSNSTTSITGTLIDHCEGNSVIQADWDGATVSLAGCTISNCLTGGTTGLIYGYSIYVTDTVFSNNTVTEGNAFVTNGSAEFTNCLFTGNHFNVAGTTCGLFHVPSYKTVKITGCTFTDTPNCVISLEGTGTIRLNNFTLNIGTWIYCSSKNATVDISGLFISKGMIRSDEDLYPKVYIASGTTISFQANGVPAPIRGSIISAQGPFTVIDGDGNPHEYQANTKTNSSISNTGIWS